MPQPSERRTRDAWGDPYPAPRTEEAARQANRPNAWGRRTTEEASRTNPWGRSVGAKRQPSRFRRVEKLQTRTHDAWGSPLAESGVPQDEFDRAVIAAQEAIFEKARVGRSDDHAIGYVDALTKIRTESATSDRDMIAALQEAVEWSHSLLRPAPARQATPPVRTESRIIITETKRGIR